MGGKSWSKEDENRLVLAYQAGTPIPQIAAMFPNRTKSSVKTFASKIGVRHPDHRPWTPEEEVVLVEIWTQPRILKVGMNRLPGRTYDAVRVHAKAMGLGDKPTAQKGSRSPFFNSIIGEIKKHGPLTSLELSRLLKVSRRTVQRVLQDCHGVEFHVGDWKNETSKHLSRMWANGPGPDVPKPSPKSALDVHKDYRIRKRIKSGRTNPFAAALGLVETPKGEPGRVYIHLTDSKDDEYAEAA